jgi:hypothetical protein
VGNYLIEITRIVEGGLYCAGVMSLFGSLMKIGEQLQMGMFATRNVVALAAFGISMYALLAGLPSGFGG